MKPNGAVIQQVRSKLKIKIKDGRSYNERFSNVDVTSFTDGNPARIPTFPPMDLTQIQTKIQQVTS